MNITDFLQITIVGVFLSLVIQIIKTYFDTSSLANRALTLALSVIVGAGYVLLQNTPYFQTVVVVLGVASIVYNYVIKPIEA